MDTKTKLMRKRANAPLREWHGKYVNYLRLIGQGSTSKRYDAALQTFFDHFKNKTKPEQILRPDVNDYIIMRKQEGAANPTVNLELSAGKSFFEFYIQMTGAPIVNPFGNKMRLKEAERPKRALPMNTVDKIMTAAADNPMDTLLALLAFTTGLRGEEMVLLEKLDFDFETSLLVLPPEKVKGKKKGRKLPVREDLLNLVRELPDGRLFEGYARTAADIRYRWRRLCWKAEVPPMGLHAARHTYATQMLRAGADLATVRDLLGHASLKTTGTYLSGMEASEVKDLLNKLPRVAV